MPGAGNIIGNVDLGGFFNGLIGHPAESQALAQGQASMADSFAQAQIQTTQDTLTAQQAIEEKKIEAIKWVSFSAVGAAVIYIVLKILW